MSGPFSISDLAREFGVTTRTIRHYEDLGLLSPERRGQTRIFSSAQRTRLKLILRGRRLGFSLEESREIVDMYRPGQDNRDQIERLLSRVAEQRQRLRGQLADINAMLEQMDEVEQGCEQALAELSGRIQGKRSQ